MRANRSPSIKHRRVTRAPILCFAFAARFALASFAARRQDSQELNALKISVEDPRPVSKAIETLEDKYGWIITYEDPRYVHTTMKNSDGALVPQGSALDTVISLPAEERTVERKMA